jgi:RNA polymerase sigma-70 factor (ECF subfamily)
MQKNRFETIVHQYKDSIYSYAYYFSGSPENAEDLTQGVLLKIWQGLDRLRMEPARSWVMKITRNHCIDWFRSQRPKDRASVPLAEQDHPSEPGVYSAERDVQRMELRETILRAISRLPEKLRSLIILREIEDMKYEEISHALDMPLNSVKASIHRGRRLLREHLSSLYEREYQGR